MGYNSHPKIMKKLFYSFVMLVAMSLTFVACEQKNPDDNKQEIKSNCELFVCQYSIDETGHAMYVFEFSTNGLDIVNAKGSGDYLVLMAYAKPGADGFPTENTYKLIPFEELANSEEWEECIIGPYAMSETQLIGTFAYIIENDEATDILLCTSAEVKFEGNKTNGTIIANLELESALTGDIVTKEYIYSGAMNLEEAKAAAPSRVMKLNK